MREEALDRTTTTEEMQTPEFRPGDGESARSLAMEEELGARLQRVRDYMYSAVQKENPLESNLASLNAGLMRLGVHLEEAIERAMTTGVVTIERLPRIHPSLEAHLRLMRQIERFAHLEQQFARSHRAKEPDNLPGNGPEARGAREDWRS
jgi:hypothetical protein